MDERTQSKTQDILELQEELKKVQKEFDENQERIGKGRKIVDDIRNGVISVPQDQINLLEEEMAHSTKDFINLFELNSEISEIKKHIELKQNEIREKQITTNEKEKALEITELQRKLNDALKRGVSAQQEMLQKYDLALQLLEPHIKTGQKEEEMQRPQQNANTTQLKPIEKSHEKEITPSPEVTEPIIIAQEPEMTPRKPLGTPPEKAEFKQFEREETTPVWVPQPKVSETPLEQIGQAQKEVQRQGRGFLGRGIEFGNRAYRTGRRIKKASSVIKSLAKFGAKTGGKTAIKAGAAATIEFWGPVLAIILVAIIILVFFLGLFILLTSGNPGSQDQQNPPPGFEQIPGLSISFTGTTFVTDANVPIVYNGTVTYNPPASSQIPANSITIFDQIPSNAVYQSAIGCTCSDQNCTTLQCPLTGSSMNFQITLKARENNIWVINKVYATTSYVSPGGEAPNANTCNGKYDLSTNPIGQNFGDPSCNFTKDDLYTILKQQDLGNADLWFFTIVRDESHYDPNSFTDCSTGLCTPDSQGAWGLFQMGRGKNGNLDHGDVSWQVQTSNAVSYNKQINCSFRYWSTAMAYWDTRLCP